jgi:hypothetical protein
MRTGLMQHGDGVGVLSHFLSSANTPSAIAPDTGRGVHGTAMGVLFESSVPRESYRSTVVDVFRTLADACRSLAGRSFRLGGCPSGVPTGVVTAPPVVANSPATWQMTAARYHFHGPVRAGDCLFQGPPGGSPNATALLPHESSCRLSDSCCR